MKKFNAIKKLLTVCLGATFFATGIACVASLKDATPANVYAETVTEVSQDIQDIIDNINGHNSQFNAHYVSNQEVKNKDGEPVGTVSGIMATMYTVYPTIVDFNVTGFTQDDVIYSFVSAEYMFDNEKNGSDSVFTLALQDTSTGASHHMWYSTSSTNELQSYRYSVKMSSWGSHENKNFPLGDFNLNSSTNATTNVYYDNVSDGIYIDTVSGKQLVKDGISFTNNHMALYGRIGYKANLVFTALAGLDLTNPQNNYAENGTVKGAFTAKVQDYIKNGAILNQGADTLPEVHFAHPVSGKTINNFAGEVNIYNASDKSVYAENVDYATYKIDNAGNYIVEYVDGADKLEINVSVIEKTALTEFTYDAVNVDLYIDGNVVTSDTVVYQGDVITVVPKDGFNTIFDFNYSNTSNLPSVLINDSTVVDLSVGNKYTVGEVTTLKITAAAYKEKRQFYMIRQGGLGASMASYAVGTFFEGVPSRLYKLVATNGNPNNAEWSVWFPGVDYDGEKMYLKNISTTYPWVSDIKNVTDNLKANGKRQNLDFYRLYQNATISSTAVTGSEFIMKYGDQSANRFVPEGNIVIRPFPIDTYVEAQPALKADGTVGLMVKFGMSKLDWETLKNAEKGGTTFRVVVSTKAYVDSLTCAKDAYHIWSSTGGDSNKNLVAKNLSNEFFVDLSENTILTTTTKDFTVTINVTETVDGKPQTVAKQVECTREYVETSVVLYNIPYEGYASDYWFGAYLMTGYNGSAGIYFGSDSVDNGIGTTDADCINMLAASGNAFANYVDTATTEYANVTIGGITFYAKDSNVDANAVEMVTKYYYRGLYLKHGITTEEVSGYNSVEYNGVTYWYNTDITEDVAKLCIAVKTGVAETPTEEV